jgi:hypothetical protein
MVNIDHALAAHCRDKPVGRETSRHLHPPIFSGNIAINEDNVIALEAERSIGPGRF